MKLWTKIGAPLLILGIITLIFVIARYMPSTAAFRIGPLRGSLLAAALMSIAIGLDLAVHVKTSDDANRFFGRYRTGYLLWSISQSLFIILIFIDRRFGLPVVIWLPLLLGTAISALWGPLLLLRAKAPLIPAIPRGNLLVRFDPLQDSWSVKLYSFFSRYRKWMPVFALLVVLIQFWLFRTSFSNYLAPFFPAAYDQTATYRSVYQAVFAIRDHGVFEAFRGPLWIKLGPRGWLVPFIGLLSASVFGPNRIAVAYANFLYFLCGQVALWIVLYRWKGYPAAIFGAGFFLLSNTYYASSTGGLMDLRYDFAGMITLGISFLSLVLFIEKPTYRKLLISLAIFQISVSSRSITIVYLVGAQGLLLLYFIYRQFVKQDSSASLRFVAILLAGTLIEVFLYVAMQWQPINGYYVAALRAGESPIRDAEMGLASFWERPAFYWDSLGDHYQKYGRFVIWVIVGLLVRAFTVTGKNESAGSGTFFDQRFKTTCGVFLVTGLSFFTAASMYAPSPVVASVLTIPLVFTLAVGLVSAFSWLRAPLLSILAVVVLGMGLKNYATAMITPGPMPYGSRETAIITNEIYAEVANSVHSDSSIYWMFVDQGLNVETFNIYWNETYHAPSPAGLRQSNGHISAATEEEILNAIKLSDIVIAPIHINPITGFDYPYNVSIKKLQKVWQPYLEGDFTLKESYSVARGKIGLYIRNPRIMK